METVAGAAEETRFRTAIPKSWDAAWAVAAYIHGRGGFAVQVGAMVVRPTADERAAYGDAADILVKRHGTDEWKGIEVKWRELEFSSVQDYPFSTVFVDRCEKADKTLPAAYYMVNKSMTVAAMIAASTRLLWVGPKTYRDKVKGYPVTVYECPVSAVRFVMLTRRGVRA